MPNTQPVLMINGQPVGQVGDEELSYIHSNGSDTLLEQASWETDTYEHSTTIAHNGFLTGFFNVYNCNGGAVLSHGVTVFIDSMPVANVYSQGTTPAEANSGSLCIPVKKGQVVTIRVSNGTWVGKVYVRY